MSAFRGLSVCSRGVQRLGGSMRRPLTLVPSRGVKKKTLEEGGIVYKGMAPGFPKSNSANLTVPGESEEPNQVVSALSWLGEKLVDENAKTYEEGEWTPNSVRTGAIGRKIGTMNVWDARGAKTLCTVVQIDQCQVTQVKKFISGRGHPRVNLQLGAVPGNPKKLKKNELCQFRKFGVEPKKRLAEFPVSMDAVLPVGTYIDARHFVPGQFVDVVATSNDKGFQGGMKRWGFKGQPASHGNSLAHRAIGSLGGCQDPGKVWKGKKMPGHMGKNRCTFLNMQVYKVDVERNLLFIKGSFPGKVDTTFTLKDAARKPWNPDFPPPFPTFQAQQSDEEVSELVMDVSHLPAYNTLSG